MSSEGLNIFTVSTLFTEFNGGTKMPNMTLSLPEDLKSKMEGFPEINWSEVARECLSERVKKLALLKMLESAEEKELISWSVELGRKAKKDSFKRLLSEASPKRREELLKAMPPERRREYK